MLACVEVHDKRSGRSRDPGQTGKIHRGFRAAADMQLRSLREALRQAVIDVNVLGLSGPSNFTFMAPEARLNQFAGWLETAANASLDARWWVHPWLERATQHGLAMAQQELRGRPYLPTPTSFETLHHLAHHELRGIISALVQKVIRQAHRVTARRLVPHKAFRDLVGPIDKEIHMRLHAFAQTFTVKGHIHGKVAYYRQAGLTHVGINPELRGPKRRPIRDADYDEGQHPRGEHGQWTSVYHGTVKQFEKLQVPAEEDYMLDRMLGVHVSKDPNISSTFTVHPTGGEVIEGARIIPLRLNESKYLTVPQPVYYENGPPETDQVAIAKMVMREAYLTNPDMLARFLHEARRIPQDQAKHFAVDLVAGRSVDLPDGRHDLNRVLSNFTGAVPYNAFDRRLAVDLARSKWIARGYHGLKYINTSPMETGGTKGIERPKDLTSFVVFKPSSLVQKYTGRRDHAMRDDDPAEAVWQTAEDEDVCDDCEEMAAGSPYTLDEIYDLIPLHINCRCDAVVWDDAEIGDSMSAQMLLPGLEQ